MAGGTWKRRGFFLILGSIGAFLLAVVAGFIAHESRPSGVSGPKAEEMARSMERAMNKTAWDQTLAVRWDFDGRQQHLWDRERNLSRVRWDDVEVLQNLDTQTGRAYRDGTVVTGEEGAELVAQAYTFFCNDSFWLNPLGKLFDEGVSRSTMQVEGRDELLVEYSAGGVTPGDAYLWRLGADGLPAAWKMWVSIIPIGGLEVSWEEWKELSTGAKVATLHRLGPLTFRLSDIDAATSLGELEPGGDPFAELGGD